jgi:hypothetical protein
MGDAGSSEYALFVIRRWPLDRVQYPDGKTQDFEIGTGLDARAQWQAEQDEQLRATFEARVLPTARAQAAVDHQAQFESYETRYRQWRQQLSISSSERKLRYGRVSSNARRVPVVEIVDTCSGLQFQLNPENPFGRSDADILGYAIWVDRPERITQQSALQETILSGRPRNMLCTVAEATHLDVNAFGDMAEFIRTAVEPSLKHLYALLFEAAPVKASDPAYETWRAGQPPPGEVVIQSFPDRWRASLFVETGRKDIDLKTGGGWDSSFPEIEVLGALNRFAKEGWRVISVSEDKATSVGPDHGPESRTTAVRYLLERSSSS